MTCDVCIIGGGPAGAVLATRLAQLGHVVTLIEREAFPRPHLGESLSPGVLPLLASLGLRESPDAAECARVECVEIEWENGREEKRDPLGRGRLVDRGAFDRRLLAHAAACGVSVLQPARVTRVMPGEPGWHVHLAHRGGSDIVSARFLADAAGRHGVLPRRRRFTAPRTIALHAYWRGGEQPRVPRIVAGEDGWYWRVPLPDGATNTLFFTAPENAAAARANFAERLVHAGVVSDAAMAASRLGPVRVTDATPHLDALCITPTSIKVGDAALALDPLSSSGVQKAIQSALAAAIVANTLLRTPERAALAGAFYRDSLAMSSARHAAWAAKRYAAVARLRPQAFWAERARGHEAQTTERLGEDALLGRPAADTPLTVSAELDFAEVACAGEMFIELQTAVRHPRLDAPVAYLGGHALAPLLRRIRAGATSAEIAQRWAPRVPAATAQKIIAWLWQHGIVRAAAVEAALR